MRIAATICLPSYGLKTTGLRKTTSSASASVRASGSRALTAAWNASLFIARGSLVGGLPLDRAGAQDVGSERAAKKLLHRARGVEQAPEVHAGGDLHLVQHRDEILGGDVPGRPGGQRTAAQLTECGLEGVDPLLEGRQHVREPLAARVVEVGGQLDAVEPVGGGREELAYLPRVGHPRGVAERDLLATHLDQSLGDLQYVIGRNLALVWAAEDDRDHALAAKALAPRSHDGPPKVLEGFGDHAVLVALVVALRGREEDVDLVEAIPLLECAVQSALVRDQHGVTDALRAVDSRQHVRSVGELRDHVGADEGRHLE